MNARQRVLTTLNHEQPDRVPICDWIDEPTVLNLAAYLGLAGAEAGSSEVFVAGEEGPGSLDLLCLVIKELGIDAAWYSYSSGVETVDDKHIRDKYGRTFLLSAHGGPIIAEGPIKGPSDVVGYDMTAALVPEDLDNVRYLMEKIGRDGIVFMHLCDPFMESWSLRGGMEPYLLDLILNPGLVHDLGRIATDFGLALIQLAAQIGIEVLVMGGDLAGEITTLISPHHYRQFVQPYHRELVGEAHRHGIKIIKHSDGNVWPIMDDLIKVGFDGFNPVQPDCMDIAEVKGYLDGRMSIMGNIDCRHLLPYGTPEEVDATVKETIAVAAPGGGYILSSSNSLHPEVQPANVEAMVRAAHRYGVYPISLD